MAEFLKIAGGYTNWNVYRKAVTHRDSFEYVEKCEKRTDETVANIMLTLTYQMDAMLAKVLKSLESQFIEEGGIREAMTRARRERRGY